MTDWDKHKFGPGYDICARCKGTKPPARRVYKWCAACADAMAGRHTTGGRDAAKPAGVKRMTRIYGRSGWRGK